MNTKFIEARELIVKAREALRRGDKPSAWKLGEQAALLAPDLEDAWLILAASDPDLQEALAYAQKALEINPSSTRARKGVEWAKGRLDQPQEVTLSSPQDLRNAFIAPQKIELVRESPQQPKAKPNNRNLFYAVSFLGVLVCLVLAFAAYSAATHPALASILNSAPAPTQADHWAAMEIAKPSVTPIDLRGFAAASSTAEAVLPPPSATDVPSKAATSTPRDIPDESPSATPQATETPGTLAMDILADTPTSEFAAPTSSAPLPDFAKSGNGARWIDVDLTNQSVSAYEGDVMVNAFIVSTGTWLTPTVTGQYKVYVKYRYANMHGPGYFLPDVPYVMYFYKGYGLHGTYWHNNFGTPMSHGCINLRTDDAGWLFDWASVGTMVNVHY